MGRKIAILMLSGGRDSFISACRLLESDDNCIIKMVTYDNGCSTHSSDAKGVANRIIERYGANRAEYLGVFPIIGIMREFFFPYFNMKPEEQAAEFQGMTPSQFHCLICRTSMYIASIYLAKKQQASVIAEGGREVQGFVIELPEMINKLTELVEKAGLKLELPVYDMKDDWERDNELIRRGFVSKSFEPKCLIGCPIRGSVDQDVIAGVISYFDKIIIPTIDRRALLSDEAVNSFMIYNELNEK